MKISIQLTMTFLLVASLVLIVGLIAATQSQNALESEIGANSVILAQEMMSSIDKIIYYRIEEIQAYSHEFEVRETIEESNHEFEKLGNVQGYIDEKDKEWISAPKEHVTPFMQELMDNELSEELIEKMNFYKKRYGYNLYGEVFVTNKYGANAAQTGKTSDYYQADEDWWQNAKEKGLYVEDVEFDESADIFSLAIGIRVDDEDGNFIGVIKVVLNIEDVIQLIEEMGPETSENLLGHLDRQAVHTELVSKDGKIIYSSKGHKNFEYLSESMQSLFNKNKKHDEYFIEKGDQPGEGEELFSHANSKGYKGFEGLGWVLIIEHETEEIFSSVIRLKNFILLVSIISLLIAVIIGFFVSNSITRPITKLSGILKEFGKGNLETKMEIEASDEIMGLAASSEKMAQDLKESREQINKKVEERTKQLKSKMTELEKFQKMTVGRELKMIELKNKIRELEEKLKDK